MKRSGFSMFLIMIALLGHGGCGMSKLDNIKWTQAGRDMKVYYQNDAQCLKQANKILFNQLKLAEKKRTRKSSVARISGKDLTARVCKSNNQRDRIHYNCMLKKGWLPANRSN